MKLEDKIFKKLQHCETVVVEEYMTHTYKRDPSTNQFGECESDREFARFLAHCVEEGFIVTYEPDVEIKEDEDSLPFEELHPPRPTGYEKGRLL